MRASRALLLIAVLIVSAFAAWAFLQGRQASSVGDRVTVYYCKSDGQTLVPWSVTLGTARDRRSAAFYAAAQALAGPPSGVDAIRFPNGTHVRSLDVKSSTVDVDLSGEVKSTAGGSFAESGEFKSLVWTLTALPGISSVRIRVDGVRVSTLPGGHFELDEPLSRSSW